ncbi:MAG: ABC transporter ATP-binding protein [Solirubrobacterales bacterium]|nr:ABC transporter ATP-binding protein [Solirubrobacterales bacterium]
MIVGPSGAGKTTLLRSIAGLEDLDRGSISLGGKRIDALPAHRRGCAVVFQEPRLLDHLDLLDNVAISLVAQRTPRKERRSRARELIEEVGLGEFAGGGVKGLSGGEQQRAALARALCAEPELLLLDEPLSAVDPNRRSSLMDLILQLQEDRGVTTVSVTHDRAEAAEMGQVIALLIAGTILQSDDPESMFRRPQTERTARFFGLNLIHGMVKDGHLAFEGSEIAVEGPDGEVTLSIRPEAVVIGDGGQVEMTAIEAVYLGTHVRVILKGEQSVLEAHVQAEVSPAVGSKVGVSLPEPQLWRIPAG